MLPASTWLPTTFTIDKVTAITQPKGGVNLRETVTIRDQVGSETAQDTDQRRVTSTSPEPRRVGRSTGRTERAHDQRETDEWITYCSLLDKSQLFGQNRPVISIEPGESFQLRVFSCNLTYTTHYVSRYR